MSLTNKPRTTFGKPEKPNIRKLVLFWLFVVIGIGGIIWMIAANPRQKTLVCSSEDHTLTSFGTCTEE